ncbi:MAG: VUT family protein [Parachlamydiaceae bacterium]
MTNRFHGPKKARQVVYFGFIFGAILSIFLATPKIAFGSLTAFLIAQMLDIFIFSKLRKNTWWVAPLFASVLASFVDTSLFWTLAFWGEDLPVFTWAMGDFLVKLAVDFVLLVPFRLIIQNTATKVIV